MEKPAAGRTKRVNNQGGRNRHTMRPPCPAYFFFLGPLGLEVAFRSNPFRKWVVSNFSKKTNNPNPSPIGKRFGLYGRGAGMGTRTPTRKAREPKSRMSTNSIMPAGLFYTTSYYTMSPAACQNIFCLGRCQGMCQEIIGKSLSDMKQANVEA